MLNTKELREFQDAVETNDSLRDVLTELYPTYVDNYFRFRKKVGAHCAFCRSSARFMFLSETHRNQKDFLTRFSSNNWEGYSL